MSAEREYWDRGARNVPDMTGARAVLDAHDLREICLQFGLAVPLKGLTLDVGCGTGRAAQICDRYVGLDIAPSAIEYCHARNIEAHVLNGWTQNEKVSELAYGGGVDQVLCISVFTHIPRSERMYYLQCFEQLTKRVIVDIVPGDGSGDVALWTADVAQFEQDAMRGGWDILGTLERSWDAAPVVTLHRYHLMERP